MVALSRVHRERNASHRSTQGEFKRSTNTKGAAASATKVGTVVLAVEFSALRATPTGQQIEELTSTIGLWFNGLPRAFNRPIADQGVRVIVVEFENIGGFTLRIANTVLLQLELPASDVSTKDLDQLIGELAKVIQAAHRRRVQRAF